MSYAITLFGFFFVAMSLLMVIRPTVVVEMVRQSASVTFLYVFAIAIRLGFGFALILYAHQSKFPLTLQIIGSILFASGVILGVISRDRFGRLVTWSIDRFSKYVRPAALIALVFGGFLIYAVV
jgi:hypothetical protein